MSVYEFGGRIEGVFYSYDLWAVARLLWERWNKAMATGAWMPFEKVDTTMKRKLMDIVYDVLGEAREKRLL